MDGAPGLDVLMPRLMRLCELSRSLAAPGDPFMECVLDSWYTHTPLGRAYVEEGGDEAAMAAAVASLREALGLPEDGAGADAADGDA